jgi:hypothetical protein
MEGVMCDEDRGEYFDEESLLYGREKDRSEGADAAFSWVFPAEGIRFYQCLEPGGFFRCLCAWIY